MTPSPSARIRELVLSKLAGRKIDVVGFVDELLNLTRELGSIQCSLPAEGRLRFELPDSEACEVEIDAARGKLRMLCARLSVLFEENGAAGNSPYGGEGVIQRTAPIPSANGTGSLTRPGQWTVHFENTAAKQEFTIAPAKDQLSLRSSA
jgi:hypothetical protein